MPTMPYEYRVKEIIRVVDGDTIDCVIDLGFGLSAAFRFRLAGIDTPEIYGKEASARGQEALEFTKTWLEARKVLVRTTKSAPTTIGIGDGAFGRWLAEFVDAVSKEHLTAALIDAGYGS